MKDRLKEKAVNYISEGPTAVEKLCQLKQRVQDTANHALAVHMDYLHPLEGAKLMYEAVVKYLEENVLTQLSTKLGQREKDQAPHKAFAVSRTSLFIPNQKDYDVLDNAFALTTLNSDDSNSCPHVLVLGPAGCGKSALLSNWLNDCVAKQPDVVAIPFYIGCAAGTRGTEELLGYVYSELDHLLSDGKTEDTEQEGNNQGDGIQSDNETKTIEKEKDTPRGKQEDSTQDKDKSNDEGDLKKPKAAPRPKGKELQHQMVKKLEKLVQEGRRVVLVFDAINRLVAAKISVALHWLPEKLPEGVMCVVSTMDTDQDAVDKLQKELGYQVLRMQPLDHETQRELCIQTLKRSGKELSPEQLDRIVKAVQTENPLFLKIVLAELAIFGKFRELDKKIDSLIEVSSIKELLHNCLKRLEADYNVSEYPGNLVGDILKAIYVAHQGLSESEIINIFHIPSNVWSPFNFAMDFFLISNLGSLGFAFGEFREAVQEKYLQSEDAVAKAREKLISYFDGVRRQQLRPWTVDRRLGERYLDHAMLELVILQKAQGDKDGLIRSLTDLAVFRTMNNKHELELLSLWQWTGTKGSEICNLLMKALDIGIADCYLAREAGELEAESCPGVKMRPALGHMRLFFSLANHLKGEEICLKREIGMLKNTEGKMDENLRLELLRDARYYLACTYASQDRYDDAKAMHESNMIEFEKALAEKDDLILKRQIAYTNNGLGIICMNTGDFDKGIEYLKKSAEFHKEQKDRTNEAAGYVNLGLLHMYKKEFLKALEYNKKALEAYEEGHFGQLTMDVGNLYTNIGLVHRRMNNLDKAEEAYLKSLEIKKNAVGEDHVVIATAYMNLGTLEMHRGRFDFAEKWTRKAIEVYKKNEFEKTKKEYRRCRENLFANMMKQENKQEDALPLFIEIFDILNQNGWLEECLAGMHRKMVQYMMDNKPEMLEKAAEISMALIDSPKAHPMNYFQLNDIDKALPAEKRVPRPFRFTLDGCLDRFATHTMYSEVIQVKLKIELFPKDDREGIRSLISHMAAHYTDWNYGQVGIITEYAQQEGKEELWFECLKSCLEENLMDKKVQRLFMRVCMYLNRPTEAFPFLDALVRTYSKGNEELNPEEVDPARLKVDVAKILIAKGNTGPARQLLLLVTAMTRDQSLKDEAKAALDGLPQDQEEDSKTLVTCAA
ncbi:hypothetical protein V1264_019502 [Littorina saxatilis]|uniref:AAA+ ATPase domain-containing protein n=2 Tax=Littorina saxatilis TaxID=31220 RepID=A0AAN9BG50_9CAEN